LAVGAVILIVGIGGNAFPGGSLPIFNGLPAIATSAVLGIILNAIFLIFPPETEATKSAPAPAAAPAPRKAKAAAGRRH
jgi:uracil permease